MTSGLLFSSSSQKSNKTGPSHELCASCVELNYKSMDSFINTKGMFDFREVLQYLNVTVGRDQWHGIKLSSSGYDDEIFAYQLEITNGKFSYPILTYWGGEGFIESSTVRLCRESPIRLMVRNYKYDVASGADSSYVIISMKKGRLKQLPIRNKQAMQFYQGCSPTPR